MKQSYKPTLTIAVLHCRLTTSSGSGPMSVGGLELIEVLPAALAACEVVPLPKGSKERKPGVKLDKLNP